MNRIDEINARLAQIEAELDGATSERLAELNTEADALIAERTALLADIESRQQLRSRIANGTQPGVTVVTPARPEPTAEERAAQEFAESRRMTIGTEQARSVLISGGTLATPTEVHGINDVAGAHVSSIIDLVKVVNCEGMSTNRVAYIAADAAEAAGQTEGQAAAAKEPTFAYVDITPTSVAVTAQISKQAKKQSPLNYKAKVTEQSLLALRKKAASLVTTKLVASTLNTSVNATVSSSKGKIDEKTLRNLVMSYGGTEGIGAGVLFLNKTDLVAIGDIRGTNEKKAVFEVIPDSDNPNTGIIKDGGLSVKYCINSNLTACEGTTQPAAAATSATVTMIYGDPQCFELDLFSDYEVRVSEDFAFTSLMDTIRGDVEIGGDVTVKNGFVTLVIPKAAT